MRTLALLLAMGIAGAAEAPKTQPAPAPVAPKQAPLNELQQTKIEKIQALLQLAEVQKRDLQTELQGIIDGACRDLGGAKADDCNVMPPNQGQPRYTVILKPTQPAAAAKKEEK